MPTPRRLVVALAALTALAACDPPLEAAYPPERVSVTRGGEVYDAVVRYDVVQGAHTVRLAPRMLREAALPRERAIEIVETGIGPEVCEGGRPMAFDEDGAVSLLGYTQAIAELRSVGGWLVLARCT